MLIAVIVSTYNRPDALRAVLQAYLEQTDRRFELIVADDGSGEETSAVVRAFESKAGFTLRHVWQEDRGFRAAAIRNRAVSIACGDYLLFTDGDCIPPRTFVADHRALAEPGWYVAGNRILLGERFTRKVLERGIPIQRFDALDWIWSWASLRVNRLLPIIRLPENARFRRADPHRWRGARTCNLAAWHADFKRVNGFDESYEGWGLEDSDLAIRLRHAGVNRKSAQFWAPVFHLWHSEHDRALLSENQRRLDELVASGRDRALRGLEEHLRVLGTQR